MLLSELLKTITFYQLTASIDGLNINELKMDSRNVQKGDLFVCIKGTAVDGHHFAGEAAEKGACAIVAERPLPVNIPVIIVPDSKKVLARFAYHFYGHPTRDLRLIGITGTNGKTTLTYLLEEIFRYHQEQTGIIGTIQMKIKDETYPVQNTTPDVLFLQKSFRKMVSKGVTTAMMEVSSHALDQGRVFGCDFDIAVFTNLTQDHLDYHKNFDDYLRAKTLLFSQMGNVYSNRPKFAVVNRDDPHGEYFIKSTPYETLTYGIHNEADVKAENIELKPDGTVFTMKTPKKSISVHTPLAGEFSVYNLLAAASAAICAGVPLSTIQKAFEKTKGVPGRFESVHVGQKFGVIVDYAHTPDSLKNVLKTIQSFVQGKVRVVVGCGGDRDRDKRPKMANIAVSYSDEAIFTSDNPRSEDPMLIIKDMEKGVEKGSYLVEADRRKAIEKAIDQAEEGDIVLIAGKGHETYQEINGVRYDFDDRKVALEMIEKKLKES
ncbi:MAG: UDP-N-acetylmuramoyl-L-alanyl-D-glutamate--2,6-diaminopimelate ligase [Bacillaceae bacterium]|nr:UDP-N-acetylmuramoyl-L-alanyl-D-glutamate--2,6-diaminopimelate ligase [Bacillaceae bacterium]